jgi:hypothetical protein
MCAYRAGLSKEQMEALRLKRRKKKLTSIQSEDIPERISSTRVLTTTTPHDWHHLPPRKRDVRGCFLFAHTAATFLASRTSLVTWKLTHSSQQTLSIASDNFAPVSAFCTATPR